MLHISYPSIEQFRHAVRRVTDRAQYVGKDSNNDPIYDRTLKPGVLTYQATTKLHGTNFAMVRNRRTGEIWFQSRETIITPQSDNAGAARFFFEKDLNHIFDMFDHDVVAIYGEWCGKGIQSKVAITQLPKRLVVFDVRFPEESTWAPASDVAKVIDHANSIYSIYEFPTWELDLDFSTPELMQNRLIAITDEIEKSCPVAKAFGVDGLGEGAVWRCISPGYESSSFRFKVKGEKHAGSKVKTLAPVDDERVKALMELAETVTPSYRLEQALFSACDINNGGHIELSKIPVYMKLVMDDIVKEESDTLSAAGVSIKDIAKYVSSIAVTYFKGREKNYVDTWTSSPS